MQRSAWRRRRARARLRIPWREIESMTRLRKDGRRTLAIRVRPDVQPDPARHRSDSDAPRYGVLVPTGGERPLVEIAEAASTRWTAQGGSGVLTGTVTHPDLVRLVTDAPER